MTTSDFVFFSFFAVTFSASSALSCETWWVMLCVGNARDTHKTMNNAHTNFGAYKSRKKNHSTTNKHRRDKTSNAKIVLNSCNFRDVARRFSSEKFHRNCTINFLFYYFFSLSLLTNVSVAKRSRLICCPPSQFIAQHKEIVSFVSHAVRVYLAR